MANWSLAVGVTAKIVKKEKSMTLTDIQNEVAALGFDNGVSLNQSLLCSIKRALRTIYTERGETGMIDIYQEPYLPSIYHERIVHRGDCGDTVIKVFGASYAFAASGVGGFRIKTADKTREYSFNSQFSEFKGTLNGDSEITFFGKYMFVVYDLSVYDTVRSDEPGDISRHTGTKNYDLKKYAKDFMFAVSVPKNEYAKDIYGASIHADTLSVPASYRGRIRIKYRKGIPELSPDEPDKQINLPEEYHSLLPLLTSSYFWLDDDVEKSQYYMSLYRDGMAALKLYTSKEINSSYSDVVGWA